MSTTGTAVRYLWNLYYCLALLVLGTTPPGQSAEATKDGFLCYECSNVPKERDSLDETLGRCPGWKRAAKAFGPGLPAQGNLLVKSLYDGCMTVVLYNGTIVSQNAVVFEECLRYRKTALASAMGLLFDAPVHVHCCLGSLCNGPDNASVRRLVDRGRSSSGPSRQSDSVFYTREQTLDFYRKFFKINKTGHYEVPKSGSGGKDGEQEENLCPCPDDPEHISPKTHGISTSTASDPLNLLWFILVYLLI